MNLSVTEFVPINWTTKFIMMSNGTPYPLIEAEVSKSGGKKNKGWCEFSSRVYEPEIKSAWDSNKKFVPQGLLVQEITKETVRRDLKLKAGKSGDLVNFIIGPANLLFAITMLTLQNRRTQMSAMTRFYHARCDNTILPIGKLTQENELENDPNDGESDESESDADSDSEATYDPNSKVHAFRQTDRKSRIWNQTAVSTFCEKQWQCLAPIIKSNTEDCIMTLNSPNFILPFTSKVNLGREGAFSIVWRVTIHPDHCTTRDMKIPEYFAVKQLREAIDEEVEKDVRQSWIDEAKNLQRLNKLNSPHIVKFISAIRRERTTNFDDYYLIFEWANGGSLRDRWKADRRPVLTRQLIQDTVSQFLGLARALEGVHGTDEQHFRHGDIKPENILWFKDDGTPFGTLKIGDWGLAKNHKLATVIRTKKTETKHGTRRYEPPEASHDGQLNGRHSRLYDIWAVGCVMLEHLIWMLYGMEGLDGLDTNLACDSKGTTDNQDPRSYVFRHENGKKNPYVHGTLVDWMNHMERNLAKGTALRDMLDLVRNQLLVPALGDRMASGMNSNFRVSPPSSSSTIPTTLAKPLDPAQNVVSPQQSVEFKMTIAESDTPARPQRPADPTPLQSGGPFRIRAEQFFKEMDTIQTDLGNNRPGYWDPPRADRKPPGGHSDGGSSPLLAAPALRDSMKRKHNEKALLENSRLGASLFNTSRTSRMNRDDYRTPNIDGQWQLEVDNKFAIPMLRRIDKTPQVTGPTLCMDCKDLAPWRDNFSVSRTARNLKESAKSCDMCRLLQTAYQTHGGPAMVSLNFERKGSWLSITSGPSHVVSLCGDANIVSLSKDIQVGFPHLLDGGSVGHIELIRTWLSNCNTTTHERCNLSSAGGHAKKLPTRVIDVGELKDDNVRLLETAQNDTGEYVALSHPWGDKPHFCTTYDNKEHHMAGIPVASLPATFRDAVLVTRGVGQRYLWIDSLCIIQDTEGETDPMTGKPTIRKGDFNAEAKNIESVFSDANFVIAASRSTGHYCGFLGPRQDRQVVKFTAPSGQHVYLCENIDNFEEDVLEGELNKRGWVFQEHALARRTVFFTENQTYWECGEGVRCETMGRMNNDRAAFLGDPNFPQMIISKSRGELIVRYQDLYEKYSRLQFTRPHDRPIAIDGIQNRLIDTFKQTKTSKTNSAAGGYGVFYDGVRGGLLHRSLLWRRAPPSSSPYQDGSAAASTTSQFVRIDFPEGHSMPAPSWSWMAYYGAIVYVKVEGNALDWEDVHSLWSDPTVVGGGSLGTTRPPGLGGSVALSASLHGVENMIGSEMFFDLPGGSERQRPVECVVLAVERPPKTDPDQPRKDRAHYVMLVRQVRRDYHGSSVYERIGIGKLPGKSLIDKYLTVRIR